MTLTTFSPGCVPRTKIAVLGSSTSFGSRASRARLEREFRGFLSWNSQHIFSNCEQLTLFVACLKTRGSTNQRLII